VATSTGVPIHTLKLSVTSVAIDFNYLILKNVIRDDKTPDIIVYGITDSELNSSGFKPGYIPLPYSDTIMRIDDFEKYSGGSAESKARFILKQVVPLYRDQELILNALSIRFN